MKKVRIGNDIRNLEISVTRLSAPFTSWDELINLEIYAFTMSRKGQYIKPSQILKVEDKLKLYFDSKDLSIGEYDVLIKFSIADDTFSGSPLDKAIDIQRAFEIVEHTAQEEDTENEFSVDLSYVRDGLSYYEIWSQYFEGSMEDMLAWHRQPALDAANLANEKAGLANDAASLASQKAGLANDAAILANAKALYADEQGDYASEQGDYASQQGDYAKSVGDYALAQGDYAKTQGDYAKAQGDYANTQGEIANTATGLANAAAELANTKAGLANDAAILANEKALYADEQGDFAKSVGDSYASTLASKIDKTSIKQTLGTSETDVVSQKFVTETTQDNEETTAQSLVELRKELMSLKALFSDILLTYAKITTLDVTTYRKDGAPLFIISDIIPTVVPDFVGQFYIKNTATVGAWMATGNSSVSNWKEI